MGKGQRGVQAGLRDKVIFLAPPTGLSRFGAQLQGAGPGLGLGSSPKPGAWRTPRGSPRCGGGGTDFVPRNGKLM